jgi:hypothetical protein
MDQVAINNNRMALSCLRNPLFAASDFLLCFMHKTCKFVIDAFILHLKHQRMKKFIVFFLLISFGFAASAQADTTGKMKVKHKLAKHKHKNKHKGGKKSKMKSKGTTFNFSDALYDEKSVAFTTSRKQKTA